jgi:hypothetical protein
LKKNLLDELAYWEKQLLPLPVLNGSIFEGVNDNDVSSQYADALKTNNVPKAKRKPWTQAEEDALTKGYFKYQNETNCYSKIKSDADFKTLLEARDNVALKDKIRSLGLLKK